MQFKYIPNAASTYISKLYNTYIYQFNFSDISHRPDLAVEILITECVLREVPGISIETKHLQTEHLIVENIRVMKQAIRVSKNV